MFIPADFGIMVYFVLWHCRFRNLATIFRVFFTVMLLMSVYVQFNYRLQRFTQGDFTHLLGMETEYCIRSSLFFVHTISPSRQPETWSWVNSFDISCIDRESFLHRIEIDYTYNSYEDNQIWPRQHIWFQLR